MIRRTCLFCLLLVVPALSGAEVSRAEKQYHWEIIAEFRFTASELNRVLSFCTNYDKTISSYFRKNVHILETSFNSVVRDYESHNFLWREALGSGFSAHIRGGKRAGDLIKLVLYDDEFSESKLCDKLLWVKVMDFERVTDELVSELTRRKTDFVAPMALSRIWKSKEDNPWELVVDTPVENLRRLFIANPYK